MKNTRHSEEPSQRQLRVGEELRHALAMILARHELRDPALMEATVTVSEVRVSPDLRNATAFVMPLAGLMSEEILAALRRSAPFLRGRVAREVRLRLAPTLSFELDTSFDHARRIGDILHRPEVERDLKAPRDEDPGDGA
ncbi:MAG TPA: 30S ribosome-binding factor RbfA [Stellaceae bacterium]|nr:30S ribosome-binding factor RbfA [Stellaceae bacterium]